MRRTTNREHTCPAGRVLVLGRELALDALHHTAVGLQRAREHVRGHRRHRPEHGRGGRLRAGELTVEQIGRASCRERVYVLV